MPSMPRRAPAVMPLLALVVLIVAAALAVPPVRAACLRALDALLEFIDDRLDRARIRRSGDLPAAALLLAPALVILGTFGIAPLFGAFHMSLFDPQSGFIGAGNYRLALGSDSFWRSF